MCGDKIDEVEYDGQRLQYAPRIRFERSAADRGLEEEEVEVEL